MKRYQVFLLNWAVPDTYRAAGVVEAKDLEDLLRKCNHIDAPDNWKHRSLGLGDKVRDMSTGIVYLCEPSGWQQLN